MALYATRLTAIWEGLVGEGWSLTGRTTTYLPNTAKLINADKYNDQILTISGDISAQEVPWVPLGTSAPATMLMFQADQPCDVRTNAADDSNFLSGISLMYIAGHISGIFVTTGSAATTIRLAAVGGSAATLSVSLPLP